MSLSFRETWTVIHGMVFGTLFLFSFAGGLAELWSLRPALVTLAGAADRAKRLVIGTWTMAVVAWLTVITGSYIPYVWYRSTAKTSPKSILISSPATAAWHNFGMEWKEHIAWIAPMLATVVAYLVYYYGRRLVKEEKIRKIAMTMYIIAFCCAAVAGLFGAFLNKMAPTR